MARKARNYRREYDEYHSKPEQVNRREDRNRARAKAEREGKVRKGDNKEVDHVGSHRTGSLRNVPTRVISKTANRKKQPKRS